MHIITSKSKNYPIKFVTISQSPEKFFVEGGLDLLLERPALAVVGSRKASLYGKIVTEKVVKEVASRGVVIVSGLALGIDSIAHNAALEVGGCTIAVLPSGLDNIYPPSHLGLAKRIVSANGALVSEYPPKTSTFKQNFIARNRLIAGLADAVLVTEAAIKSGSLYTANFALEQGKEVFAIPGPINSQTSEGCNNLIKSGANVCTSADDILNIFNISPQEKKLTNHAASSKEEYIILSLLSKGISDGDLLLQNSNLKPEEFYNTISMLEIGGKITAIGGNQYLLQ